MKAEGMEYDQRMEELEKLEYPKPLRDFVYETFNAFADRHPWVGEENIRPKSIAREMFENFRSFAEYVLEYELERVGGPAAAAPQQRLQGAEPDGARRRQDRRGPRDGAVPARHAAPGRLQPGGRMGADARSRVPSARGGGAAESGCGRRLRTEAPDITRDPKAFTAAIRTRVFAFLRAWSIGDHAGGARWRSTRLSPTASARCEAAWTPERLKAALDAYRVEHARAPVRPRGAQSRGTRTSRSRRTADVAGAADAGRPGRAERLDGRCRGQSRGVEGGKPAKW